MQDLPLETPHAKAQLPTPHPHIWCLQPPPRWVKAESRFGWVPAALARCLQGRQELRCAPAASPPTPRTHGPRGSLPRLPARHPPRRGAGGSAPSSLFLFLLRQGKRPQAAVPREVSRPRQTGSQHTQPGRTHPCGRTSTTPRRCPDTTARTGTAVEQLEEFVLRETKH